MTVPRDARKRLQERILAVVEALDQRDSAGELTLAEIDGSFYFTILLREIVDDMFRIRADADPRRIIQHLLNDTSNQNQHHAFLRSVEAANQIPGTTQHLRRALDYQSPGNLANTTGSAGVQSGTDSRPEQLAGLLARYFALTGLDNSAKLAMWWTLQTIYPDFAHWFMFGGLPKLRAPWAREIDLGQSAYKNSLESGTSELFAIRVCVPDAEIVGSEVERFVNQSITSMSTGRSDVDGGNQGDAFGSKGKEGHRIQIESRLVKEGEPMPYALPTPWEGVPSAQFLELVTTKNSFVELTIDGRRPTAGLIESYYDHVVIQQFGWNSSLSGRRNGQTNDVAIRTWAVALLNKTGMSRHEAYQRVAEQMGRRAPYESLFLEDIKLVQSRMNMPGVDRLSTKEKWKL